MNVHLSDDPAKALAHKLEKTIEAYAPDPVLVLYAGGSALKIFEHLNLDAETQVRTIWCAGDERVSGESNLNNYLQLKERLLDHAQEFTLVDSVGATEESPKSFSARMNSELEKIFSAHKNLHVISIQGMGEDGHTAGIFPLPEDRFQDVYEHDSTYVPVHLEGLTIDSRASITPAFIESRVDVLFGYVAGEAKKMTLESLKNDSKAIHEMPAQIFKTHKNCDVYTDLNV